MKDAITSGLTSIATFIPKLVIFFIILFVGWLIAKAIAKAINALLERAGFDGAVERGGIKRALAKSEMDASDIVGRLVFYALMLFVLELAFGVFGPNPISDLLTAIIAFIPDLVVAIIIIVVAAAIAAAVKTLIDGTLGGLSYGKVLSGIAGAFILFLGVVAALNQIGVATSVTTPLLITVLATVAGVIIVGAGGGLIKPMQARWEDYLSKAEAEAPRIKEQAAAAPSVREQAQQAKDRAQQAYDQTGPSNPADSGDYSADSGGYSGGYGNEGGGYRTGYTSGHLSGTAGYGNGSGSGGSGGYSIDDDPGYSGGSTAYGSDRG